MNRKDRRKVVSDLIKRGKFKRNGMENLFLYNPDSGIYEMISTSVANIKIRQAVNELIEKNEIDEEDFDHTDVNYIIKELSQGVENYVSQLDNFTPTDYIVTKKCRVNLQTGMTEAFNPNAYDTVALDFTYNELSEINEKSETAKFLKSSLGIEKVYRDRIPCYRFSAFFVNAPHPNKNAPSPRKNAPHLCPGVHTYQN